MKALKYKKLIFFKPDLFKPDIFKPDIFKPDIFKPNILFKPGCRWILAFICMSLNRVVWQDHGPIL